VPNLQSLKRPSGGFAMLAIDQRESLRAMLAEGRRGPVSDSEIGDFKIAVLKALSPVASAALLDRPFAWDRALAEAAVAPECALILAGDRFRSSADEIVADADIDDSIDLDAVRRQGAAAMKLLIVWRPDEQAERRVAVVDEFIARCRSAGLASIIEPVSRKPRDGRPWDPAAGILAAARELGARGADIYKAEAPNYGKGGEAEVRRQAAELTTNVRGPWVVLSSGVSPDAFPEVVDWCCREGAAGFLAGRAVWRSVIGQPDLEAALARDAEPRLRRLCEIVDASVKG
jgi:sulfofructosephosphate aldolase